MFTGVDYMQPNERGEYEIAEGTSASTFRSDKISKVHGGGVVVFMQFKRF